MSQFRVLGWVLADAGHRQCQSEGFSGREWILRYLGIEPRYGSSTDQEETTGMGRVEAAKMERRCWRNSAREERELVGIKCLSTHLNSV